jgi:aryl-alcohol dehydrogenase-like predicted oxidoreductase
LRAHENLLKQGKVRALGGSNYNPVQLREALEVAARQQLTGYQVLQPEYNLYSRSGFEAELRDLCIRADLGVITYFSLASGFLSGKYRSKDDIAGRARADMLEKYFDARGQRILAALEAVAEARNATAAEVALAWLMTRDGVTAPIASATSLQQLDSLLRATQLTLSTADLDALSAASH